MYNNVISVDPPEIILLKNIIGVSNYKTESNVKFKIKLYNKNTNELIGVFDSYFNNGYINIVNVDVLNMFEEKTKINKNVEVLESKNFIDKVSARIQVKNYYNNIKEILIHRLNINLNVTFSFSNQGEVLSDIISQVMYTPDGKLFDVIIDKEWE